MTGLQIYGLIMPFILVAGAFTAVKIQHRIIQSHRRAQQNTPIGAAE
jgi:hypothetical protein